MSATSKEFAGAERRDRGASQIDLEMILQSVRETAYRWDFASDRIDWAAKADAVLRVTDLAAISSGRSFALLIDPEQAGPRYDAVTGGTYAASDADVQYRTRYRFLPDGRRGRAAIWVEETGICRIGADGLPKTAQGTIRAIDDRREQEERLLFLSSHDELTGQLNRTRLTEELDNFLSSATKFPRRGGFLLIAVNALTLINETYGFEAGDEVISIVGQRLGRLLRQKDRIGRYSSNKFGVLIDDCQGDDLASVALRLIGCVRDSALETSAGTVAASVSTGALLLPDHAETPQVAIGRALEALEIARNSRDRFFLYVPCERRDQERRHTVGIADEIVRALNDRRLLLALQPIVAAKSRKPESYECLLRICRLDGSLINASEFIPVAEQFGIVKLVDHRALELAVELLRSSPGLKLALNISAETAADQQWFATLEAVTASDRSLMRRLTIEIAEAAAVAELAETIKLVGRLKELGCRVALDHFGAGYSSFRSLRQLGVDLVKIDGCFIQNIGKQPEDELFVRTLIELAKNCGIATVGEWVTDERTARFLENAGISSMQGYLFGAPELATGADAKLGTGQPAV